MALFGMDINNLQDLFVEQLRDLFDGEQQLTEALPPLIVKASSPQLKNGLQQHLEQTRRQIQRLEQCFQALGKKPAGETCKGMRGILKECDELVSKGKNPSVIDACIIAGTQRVEHYEIAGYGTVCNYARLLGKQDLFGLLEQTLKEEKDADALLTQVAGTANVEAEKAA